MMNRLHARLLLVCTTMLGAAGAAAAQSVGPPIAEYVERATGTFELTNGTLVPSTVVIEAFGFSVDTLGMINYHPFDTSLVRLKLSTTTVRVPPRSSFTVGYEATSRTAPAWFVIASNFSAPRTAGLNLRIQLPHVVYLHQKLPLEREAVKVRAIVHDTAAKKVRIKVENTSDRLGRVLESSLRSGRGDVEGGAFPLFPKFWRWVDVDWPHAEAPVSVRLAFERFNVDVRVADLSPQITATKSP